MVGVTGDIEAGGRRRRRRALLSALALALATAALLGAEPAWGSAKPGKEHAVFKVAVHEKVVALSFDDGPDPRWTPQVLRLLASHGDRATFFEIGQNAAAHPDLVAAVLDGGNEVGNHTYDHQHLPDLDASGVRKELARGTASLVAAGAPRPALFRPPLGLSDEAVADAAEADHMRLILWTSCVEKYIHHAGVANGTDALLRQVRPGAIILAHDGGIPDRAPTMEALPLLLDGLQRRGYRVVTVSELLALGGGSRRPAGTAVKRTS